MPQTIANLPIRYRLYFFPRLPQSIGDSHNINTNIAGHSQGATIVCVNVCRPEGAAKCYDELMGKEPQPFFRIANGFRPKERS